MGIIIDGKKYASEIKDRVVKEIFALGDNKRPNLAIILVGNRPDSELYVKMKEREAKKVGVDTHVYRCEDNISEREVFDMIDCLNNDNLIDAILVQLPLPAGFDTDGIIRAIDPGKDVDRFHPDNLEPILTTCSPNHILPPLFEVVNDILCRTNCNLNESRAMVVSNSDVFGKSLAKVLTCQGALAEAVKSNDKDLKVKMQQADIVISVVGKSKFIKKDMIKKDAIVIDIGISRDQGSTVGDVDLEDVKEKVGYITPVPGGTGPMTVAYLFKNCLELYKKRKG